MSEQLIEVKPKFSKPAAFFWMLRFNRTMMVAAITGTAAFASSGLVAQSLWMTLAGWCLAVGGFSLDFNADRDLDKEGPRAEIRHNPLSDGSLSPLTGLVFSISFIVVSFIITVLITPWALIPWFCILAVIIGLALHLFEHPLSRAFTLGFLQFLYFIMGTTVGGITLGLALLAVLFFFAMFGGRGIIDIRDFPQDKATRVQTFPIRYGIKRTVLFATICEAIALLISLGVYFTGEFSRTYLYLSLAFIAVGIASVGLFIRNPTPILAYKLTLVFMMGMGSIICLAVILGSI